MRAAGTAVVVVMAALLGGCAAQVERAHDLDPGGSVPTHLASAVVVYQETDVVELAMGTNTRTLDAVGERLVDRLAARLAVHGLVLRNDPARLAEVPGHAPDPSRSLLGGTRWHHPRGVTGDLLDLNDEELAELAAGRGFRDDEAWAGARVRLKVDEDEERGRASLRAWLDVLVIGGGARILLRGGGYGWIDLGSEVALPVPGELMQAALDEALRDFARAEVALVD